MERGKYDDICEQARIEAYADAAFLIIVRGNEGSGFSCSTSKDFNELNKVAEIFETLAVQIRKDLVGRDKIN